MEASTKVATVRSAVQAGLIGRAIQQSRTPWMHKAEGARLGFSYEYRLLDFDDLGLADADLPRVLARARSENFAGLNVTHPFKEAVIATLDELSPDAAAIGAVNTVVFAHDRAVGYNTDCWGFAESFRHGLSDARINDVVLLGAGGAGKAVAEALLNLGADRLTIHDAERTRAARLARKLQARFPAERILEVDDPGRAVATAHGLVNATPMGMAKYPGMPVPENVLRPDLWVADIVYFPVETELLRVAKAAGCRTLPGTGMAVFQAVKAFELITGVRPDPVEMERHFQEARDHQISVFR